MTLEDSTTYQLILNKGIKQGEVWGEARDRRKNAARKPDTGRHQTNEAGKKA